MKKTFKRFLAFAMVAVMMANPMSALAADTTTEDDSSPAIGSADASGNVEGFVDTTIFKVVLPTSAGDTFNFIMDPQGLIAETSGEAYGGTASADFEDAATVFFKTSSADATQKKYESTSKYIEVLNRGTVAVNVSVEATVTGLNKVKMVSGESAFTSGDAAVPELYLAFVASGDCTSGDAAANTTPILTTNSKTTATIAATMPAASADFYEFNYVSGDYTFDLTADKASGDATIFPDYSFALTGACNSEADWTDAKTEVPDVNVIWTLTDAEATPNVQKTATFTKGTALNIPVNLGTGDTAATKATVTVGNSNEGPFSAVSSVSYDANSKAIVIADSSFAAMTNGAQKYLKVTFNDTSKTSVIVTVTIAE